MNKNANSTPESPKKSRHAISGRAGEALAGTVLDRLDDERDKDNAAVDAAHAGAKEAGQLGRTASSAYQKRKIRRDYANAKAGRLSHGAAAKAARQAASTGTKPDRAVRRVFRKGKGVLPVIALALMLLYILNTFSACAPIAQAVLQAMIIGTYPAEEADVLAAEQAYQQMERDLQDELDNYIVAHPEYDEAVIDQMELWHDPYALIAFVCAYIGDEWTIESAYPVLERIFEAQYEVTAEVERETRYRIEPVLDYEAYTDPITGEVSWIPYYRDVEVPYLYNVAKVRVVNRNLSHLPSLMLSHEQLGVYALYMASLGNMPDLFAGMPHASHLEEPLLYDVPQAYKDADPQFAKLIEEAEKYLGYPYVWGGNDPSTSFDCSGFISWIFSTTGIASVGGLGATGLYGACRPISEEEARPGDVIFFSGTLGEGVDGNEGITHCGLYVGDGMMIHCGNPLSYADLNTTYWQEHFYGYGRLYG